MNLKTNIISTLILSISLLTFSYCQIPKQMVKTGIDVLIESDFAVLKGKKIGLISNPTGVDGQLRSTVDLLHQADNVDLIALFGPEHGIRGNFSAGEQVRSNRDPITGIPVYSLYGKNRKPAPHVLEDLDLLIYDIQDIGVRSYTYISTMGLAMEAAAENNIPFMVLDRPNPLGGIKLEGALAEKKFFSLVGAYPIPYVYGLTVGELAMMINEEGWLKNNVQCDLKIVKMEGWERTMDFKDTGLKWVPSSPHIPHAHKAPYYVASGILGELGVIDIGVGYTLPFEMFGTVYLNPYLLIDELNKFYNGKVIFRPMSYKPYYGKRAGKLVHGFQLHIIDTKEVQLMSIQFKFLEIFHKVYPNIDIPTLSLDRHNMFDKVCGSDKIREAFFKKYKYDDIRKLLNEGLESFRKSSSKYYLY